MNQDYDLSPHQHQQIRQYVDLLIKWNKVFKLTAITDKQEIMSKHIADGLSIVSFCRLSNKQNILDLGSGMGVPGVILAIMLPEYKITLLDSNSKKTAFLLQVKIDLNLNNVTVINQRAEDCREQFELVVTRAFAHCDKILAVAEQLLTPSGTILAMKGMKFQEELDSLSPARKELWNYDIIPLSVPSSTKQHAALTRYLLTFQRKHIIESE